ncbi:MAG: hypothetical protein LM575_07330 [Caldimicrobium sp.]|nr:hypothetical protein [Caldimicrobium sp.]
MDWEGKAFDFTLNSPIYSVNLRQQWTDYKKWTDFGRKWVKAEKYYTKDEMLRDVIEPCYKFMWWKIEREDKVNFISQPQPQPQPIEWQWQCDKVKYVGNVDFSKITYFENLFHGMYISPDGVNLYMLVVFDWAYLYWFELRTPWDITTAVYKNRIFIESILNKFIYMFYRPFGIYFSPDGKNFYIRGENKIFQFNLAKPWDITTIFYSNKSCSSHYAVTIKFNPDGTKMYLSAYRMIGEFSLATPWDISTIINPDGDAWLSFRSLPWYPYDYEIYVFDFKADGSGIYFTGRNAFYYGKIGEIHYCDLPSPWSLKNYIYRGVCFDPAFILRSMGVGVGTAIANFIFTKDGKFVYLNFSYLPIVHIFTVET